MIIKIGGRYYCCIVIFPYIKPSISTIKLPVFYDIRQMLQELISVNPLRLSFLDNVLEPHKIIAPRQCYASYI